MSTTSFLTVTPASWIKSTCFLWNYIQTKAKHKVQSAVFKGNAPVVPVSAPLRVAMLPVTEASRVDRRSWPGVRPRAEVAEVTASVCDWSMSQGGSVIGDTEVTDVLESTLSEDRVMLSESWRGLDSSSDPGRRLGWKSVLAVRSVLLLSEWAKLEAVIAVGGVRLETVAVKVGGDVTGLSSTDLLLRLRLLSTFGGSVSFSYKLVIFWWKKERHDIKLKS